MKAVYLDHMGDDLAVVRAAKVSFADDEDVQHFIDDIEAKGLGCRSHSALIRYLARHDHWTPFAHTAIKLRMTAPVPIRTQCFKHKQGFVENEESRRYIKSRPVLFVPEHFRSKPEGSVKQGSGGVHPASDLLKYAYTQVCEELIGMYEEFIDAGVCPEQARFLLPQGCEVNWIWTGNLYSFANFFLKRTDSHAQKEIQELAQEAGRIIEPLFPISWAALTRQEVSTCG